MQELVSSPRLVVKGASQIVSLAGPARARVGSEMGDIGVMTGVDLVCSNGLVEGVFPAGTSSSDGKCLEIVDATGCVVLPGFVDAHTHLVFAGNRLDEMAMRSAGATYAEIAAAGGGIRSTVAKTRAASEEELVEIAFRHANRFLANGTTTIEAKSGYGLDLETELRILRAMREADSLTRLSILPTYLGAHAFPAEFTSETDAYVESILSTIDLVAEQSLALWCDVFVEEGYFSADHARRIAVRAHQAGLRMRMHVDQFADSGGAALAAELGADSADHLEYTSTAGIEELARAGVVPVLLPASVYCLGLLRYPAAREMIDRGLPVVVATDFNPGSSPTFSMPFVTSLACTQMRMTPEEALTAATINPAYSLAVGDRVGSLEQGKQANFTIWPCQDWREIVYHPGSIWPSQVFVSGNCVV